SAEAFGVAGAAPVSLRDADTAKAQAQVVAQLQAQGAAVLAELKRREGRVAAAAADDAQARLQAVFGGGFVSLPVMLDSGGGVLAYGGRPTGASAASTRAWFARAARVREGAQLLDGALTAAELVARTRQTFTPPRFDVRQLGGVAPEPWIALPLAAGA